MKKSLSRREALRWLAVSSAAVLAACQKIVQPDSTFTAIPPAPPLQTPTVSPNSTINPTPTATEETTEVPETQEPGHAVKVYFTRDISSDGLMRVFKALNKTASGHAAVKISSGEPGGHNFLSPELIAPLVKGVNGTIVETNTAYGGPRADTASHLRVLEDHGFTAIAPVDVLDAEGSINLPISGGKHLTEDVVGSHIASYDFVVNLAHFKGHGMAGFGGVIKNMSIGIASSMGKSLIHSAGSETTGYGINTPKDDFLESMAEAAKGVVEYLHGNILHINVMNKLSVDCDCDSYPAAPTMQDIGILSSLDPVALDQACVDLVYAASDGQDLIARIESRHGIHTLEYAEVIGLGLRGYELIILD